MSALGINMKTFLCNIFFMTKWMSEYLGGGFGFIGKTNSELREIYMLCKRTKLFFSNIRRLVLASIRKALRKIQLSTIEKLVLQ